jgi:hypothetical protein
MVENYNKNSFFFAMKKSGVGGWVGGAYRDPLSFEKTGFFPAGLKT